MEENPQQPPAERADFIPQYFKTRERILQNHQPLERLTLMEGAIAEGDERMAVYALETLRAMPDAHPDVPDRINPDKFIHTILLTEALAEAGMVAQGEEVVAYADTLDRQMALEAMDAMLWRGYTGPNGSYLTLGAELVGWADVSDRIKLQYAAHLAAYGQDALDLNTDAGGLFDDCLPPDAARHEVDRNMLLICRAYARTGQFDRAAAAADTMHDPYWQREAALAIARNAQQQGNEDAARTWLARGTNLTEVANCDASCGRPSCNPAADVRTLQSRAAVVHAMRGDFATALTLVDPEDPLLAAERREIYVAHYENTGNQASRALALNAITTVTDVTVADQVERMFRADIQWGNTLTSLEADDETIPTICWEIHEMYAGLSEMEQRLQGPEGELERTVLEQLFRVDVSDFMRENAATRDLLRDQLMANMVKLLAPTAPHTAYALLQLVEDYAERCRAIIAVGRQYGYEGFFKREPASETTAEPVVESAAPEKKGGVLGSTSDMVLNALRRLIESFRYPDKE